MQKLNQMFFLLGIIAFAACQSPKEQANYQVIPLPQEVVLAEKPPFVINEKTVILYPEGNDLMQRNAAFLSGYLKESTGKALKTAALTNDRNNAIILNLDATIGQKEGYEMKVDAEHILITGQTEAGVFYGIQTLRKSISTVSANADIELPAVVIKDSPRFVHREMMLDVARHFFTVEEVKTYIDILTLHNINNFHWHLTDDQGWRIEIKKYPKLTEIGSTRKRTVIGRNTNEYDNAPYGGFYTQEQIKEVVAYAQERYINIVPEVDLPGHMLAAMTAYPELGCTGGPYEVSPDWGIFDDVLCIGNDETMKFLKDVLDEVTDLFPSKYIHIGGDEAPRVRWEKCPKCQARIKKEGLKADKKHTAEDRLQSYCTQQVAEFLATKGRRIIGWDEILEGDIAPNAIVMSWRGIEGGIEAARLGHDVIMVPTSHAYLDYYQTDDVKDEPLSIGGFVSLERVYSLEPVPDVLTEEEKKHIIGVQANLWTEYITTFQHVEYMVLPRMAALAEVQWTQPEKKNYIDFARRLPRLMKIYEKEGYNYAKHVYDLKVAYKPQPDKKSVEIQLSTVDDAPIYYSLDGSEPTSSSFYYESPIMITESADFKAVAIRPIGNSRVVSEQINFNKATGCPITLTLQPSEKYKFNGATTLIDGLKGNDSYATGRWLGFIGGDMEAIIDLQQATEIKRVATEAIVDMSAWVMGSTGLIVYVSDDNQNFREIAAKEYPADTDTGKKSIDNYEVTFDPVITRYVKVIVKRSTQLPKGHNGEGKTPYMFIDEITIE